MHEAWQAQAWALAEALKEAGRIDPAAFAAALGARLAAGQASDDDYWQAFLAVLSELAPLDPAEVAARRDAWEAAYRRTPHGAPVTLD